MIQRKKQTRRSMRTSISMPAQMFLKAVHRQRSRAYPTFSDYIQELVRRDAMLEETPQ